MQMFDLPHSTLLALIFVLKWCFTSCTLLTSDKTDGALQLQKWAFHAVTKCLKGDCLTVRISA